MSAFQDNLTIIFFLSLLAFGGLLVVVIVDAVDDAFQSAPIDQQGKDVTAAFDVQTPKILDWLVGVLFIGLPLIAMGLAFTNYVPPIFYWLAMLAAFAVSIVGFIAQDIWGSYTVSSVFSNAASTAPLTDFLFGHFGYYVLIVWLLLGLGTYVKTQDVGVGF